MTPIELAILWFGMITTGFFAGMGNQVAQYYFENHLKKHIKKIEEVKIKSLSDVKLNETKQ